MMIYTLPIIAGLIGWFTNYIAVKMLFRPRKQVNLYLFKLQGIFPKRQKKLAEKIGKMVADELLSTSDITSQINNPATLAVINENIEEKINDYLENSFPNNYPLMSLFIGQSGKEKIKADFMAEVKNLTPQLIEGYMDKIGGFLDIENVIKEKIEEFPPERLENLIMGILASEFKFIELIGAILGFMIGCIQILLVRLD